MSIANGKTMLLAFVCALPCFSGATTVTAIVTPGGIAMASDSGRSTHTGDFSPIDKSMTTKFVVVQNRIVVFSIGVSDISVAGKNGPTTPYAFLGWMSNIERKLPPNISVDDLASIIERESATTFDGFDNVLNKGFFRKKKALEDCRTFIQYVIAGYSNGAAKIYVVKFYIDWERKQLIGPKRIPLFPSPESTGSNYIFFSFGITEVLDDVSNPESYAYKTITANCPAFSTLVARQDVTIAQSLTVAREFVRTEEKTNPSEVFGPIVSVAVLPDGRIMGLNASHRKVLSKASDTHKK